MHDALRMCRVERISHIDRDGEQPIEVQRSVTDEVLQRFAFQILHDDVGLGRWPCSVSHLASLPVVVVLPEPCKPTIIHTDGGREAKSGFACLPSIAVSSSRTVLTTCWSGDSCSITSLTMG